MPTHTNDKVFHKLKEHKSLMQGTPKHSIFAICSKSREKSKTTANKSWTLSHGLVSHSDMKVTVLKLFDVYYGIKQINNVLRLLGTRDFTIRKENMKKRMMLRNNSENFRLEFGNINVS